MIERGFELLRRLPPKAETVVGVAGATIYGIMTAVPAEVQNAFKDDLISGWLINILSAADLRMGAGALTIAFGVVAFDGLKKMLSERSVDIDNQE